MSDRQKIYMRVKRDFYDKVSREADSFGVTNASLLVICAKIGLNYLIAVTDPENLISTEKMVEILEEASSRGVEFKIPDELRTDE